jgi:RNA polymerase sigma factor (sigma-70 family)
MHGVKVMAGLSFEELFREQYPALVAVGVSVLGSADTARDLAQETMARAHANWATVAAADVPEAWLRRVMNNLLVDHLRRRQVEERALQRVANRPPVEPMVHGSATQMAEMLAVLPERQRLVVALTYVADLSVADVAAALGIAPGTVKASLWKARRTLEKHLNEESRR